MRYPSNQHYTSMICTYCWDKLRLNHLWTTSTQLISALHLWHMYHITPVPKTSQSQTPAWIALVPCTTGSDICTGRCIGTRRDIHIHILEAKYTTYSVCALNGGSRNETKLTVTVCGYWSWQVDTWKVHYNSGE